VLPTPSLSPRNITSSPQPLIQLPANILEAFIPGYGTISRLLLETFGFDITLIVSVSFLVFALVKSIAFLKSQFLTLMMRFGTCQVEIASDIDTYFWIMDWLADRGVGKKSHSLTALPPSRKKKGLQALPLAVMSDPHRGVPSLGAPYRIARKPQRYEPSLGLSEYFWHNGRLFLWYRQRKYRQLTGHMGQPMPTSLIEGRLFCLSRTTEPLKALIDEAGARYHQKSASKTVIRRPATQQQRQEGGNPWKTVATRPSRPMNTVVFDHEKKENLVSDIDEYLQPSSRVWYSTRGIPYRRGYVSPLLLPLHPFSNVVCQKRIADKSSSSMVHQGQGKRLSHLPLQESLASIVLRVTGRTNNYRRGSS